MIVGKILHILKKSALFKQSAVYLVSDGISKAIPFVILPIISYYLTPSDYGILTNYNVIVQIFAVFCYSITSVIIPVMYFKLDSYNFKSLISNIVLLNCIVGVILLLITLFTSTYICNVTFVPPFYQILAVVSTVFASFTHVNLALWRCEGKALRFGCFNVSQTALDAGLSLYLVIVLLLGWSGRVFSIVVANTLLGLLSLILIAKRGCVNLRYSKTNMCTILSFAIPLIPHGLSFWIKSGADKLMLSSICGLNENGLYSVAMTFGAIVSIFVASFNNAFVPYLFKKLKGINCQADDVEKGCIVKQYRLLILGLIALIVACYILSIAFIEWAYKDSYMGAKSYLPYIMLGQLFMGLYSLIVNFIHYTQKTKVLGVMTFSLTMVQVLLSYILIKLVGSIGSAISSAIISFLIFVAVAIYSNHIYPMPWKKLIQN